MEQIQMAIANGWTLAAVSALWFLVVLWPEKRTRRRRGRRKWRPTAKDFDALGKVDCREHPRWKLLDGVTSRARV